MAFDILLGCVGGAVIGGIAGLAFERYVTIQATGTTGEKLTAVGGMVGLPGLTTPILGFVNHNSQPYFLLVFFTLLAPFVFFRVAQHVRGTGPQPAGG